MNLLIRILTRTNTVDDVLRGFNKMQKRLSSLHAALVAAAQEEQAEAAKLAARAAERYTEADRAIQVANRILDLTR